MSETISTTVKSKTIVKKIVVGTPVRRVTSGAFSVDNLTGFNVAGKQDFDIFVYDSDQGVYVSSRLDFTGGLSRTYSRDSDALTISLDATGVTTGTYGSDSNFPYFTVDSQGQLSFAGEINLNTNYITEGGSNLFYTDARVMSALDSISTSIRPDTDALYDLGDSNLRFRDLYLSGNTIYIGGLKVQDESTSLTIRDSSGNPAPIIFGSLFASDSSRIDDNLSVKNDLVVGGTIYGTGQFSVTDSAAFDNNVSIDGNLTVGGNIHTNGSITGKSIITIDPSGIGDNTGTVIIAGGLQVDGTTTTINSTTLVIDDKNIVIADGANNPIAADGAGITVGGGVANITYSDDQWVFDKAIIGQHELLIEDSSRFKAALSVGTNLLVGTNLNVNDDLTAATLTGVYLGFDSDLARTSSRQTIRGYFSASGDLTYDSATGQFTFDVEQVYTKANFDSDLNLALETDAVTTTDLTEGNNLYYTRGRFDSALGDTTSIDTIRGYFSAAGDLSYDSATGVFQFDVEDVYTQANFDSDFNTSLDAAALDGIGIAYNSATNTLSIDSAELASYFSTDNITEGGNLYYTRGRFDSALGDTISTQTIRGYFSAGGDLTYDSATGRFEFDVEQVYTSANFDSDLDDAISGGIGINYNTADNTINIDSAELAAYFSTNNITEGSNLYYTTARFDSDFGDNTTSNLTEGSNLYYTKVRTDSDVAQGFSDRTTDALAEGSNLYYTRARFDSALGDNISTQTIRGYFSAAGDLSYDSATGQFNIDVEDIYTSANFDSDLDAALNGGIGINYNTADNTINIDSAELAAYFSTDNITEGSNLYYTTARFDSDFGDNTTSDLTEGSNLYYTTARFDSDFGDNTTSDLTEGSNLYYTTARADSDFDVRLATKSTTNLAEGSNLYYTKVRTDSDIDAAFVAKSTSDLSEGSNLYYTSARADSDAKNAISVTDAGGDGSLSYAPATGIITYTGPSASEARAHFSVGANGLTYNSSTGVFDIDSTSTVFLNNLNVSNNVVITGNLQVNGTQTIINTENLSVDDNMIYLNQLESAGSPTQYVDVGFAANYNDIGSYAHTGFFRDATDGRWKLFHEYTPEPDSDLDIDVNHPSYAFAPLQIGALTATTLTGIYQGFDSDFNTKSTSDLSEGSNLYYTTIRFDSDFGDNTTSNLTEGSNLYYTKVRTDSDIDAAFVAKSTTDLSEGSNLYYTKARVDSDVAQGFTDRTTSDLAEGSNLYYTTARFDSDFDDNTTSDLTEGSNLYYTKVRVDSDVAQGFTDRTTDNLTEGSVNLYYTTVRSDSDFDIRLATKTTDNLSEGSVNLYYTTVRHDSDFAVSLAASSTSNLSEGTNLYYTSVRVDSDILSLVDSAYVQARQLNFDQLLDSSEVIDLVDSAYIQARQDYAYSSLTGVPTNVSSFTNDANYLDSTTVTGVIDQTYVTGLIDTTYLDSAETLALIDSAYIKTVNYLDNETLSFGTDGDLEIYHNGSHSFVQDGGTGNLYLRSNGAYVQIDGGGNGTVSARLDPFGAAELYHQGGNLKLATTATGIDVTGEVVADSATVTNISLPDNGVASFGNASDLQIYNNGTNSFITEGGLGDLVIQGGNIRFETPSSEYYIRAYNNGKVALYYDNSVKLETLATGITVTGEVVADSGTFTNLTLNGELVDSAWVQARQVDIFRDSAFITDIVDTAYIQARDRIRDSNFVQDIVDSAYVSARVTFVETDPSALAFAIALG